MEKTEEQLRRESENVEYDYFELKRFTHLDMYRKLGPISYVQWIIGRVKSHLPKRFYTVEIKPSKKMEERLTEGLCLEAKLNQQ